MKVDGIVKSLPPVMPDMIGHPEVIEKLDSAKASLRARLSPE